MPSKVNLMPKWLPLWLFCSYIAVACVAALLSAFVRHRTQWRSDLTEWAAPEYVRDAAIWAFNRAKVDAAEPLVRNYASNLSPCVPSGGYPCGAKTRIEAYTMESVLREEAQDLAGASSWLDRAVAECKSSGCKEMISRARDRLIKRRKDLRHLGVAD